MEGENRYLNEPFELSIAHDRAQSVFPQLPKMATSSQLIDMKQINPSRRGLDEVQTEGEFGPNGEGEADKGVDFDRWLMEQKRCGERPNPLKTRGFWTYVSPGYYPGETN